MSVNASASWFGTTASIPRAYYTSHIQAEQPSYDFNTLNFQMNKLEDLKRSGIIRYYPSTPRNATCKVVDVPDESYTTNVSQLCCLVLVV